MIALFNPAKIMKTLLPLFLLYFILTACSSKKAEPGESSYNLNKRLNIHLDSAYGFKIGDAFLPDSLKSYGFLLIEIDSEALSFVPVKLAAAKNDLDKIVTGDIRLIPSNSDNPDNGEYGIECLGVMGDKQIKEAKENFKWIGNLKLKRPLPEITAVLFGSISSEGLYSFKKHFEDSGEGRSKMLQTSAIIE
ncbi:MAG: hypothetical protein JWM14_3363 [Chitinophagaceae bacterium]|nr:hypothetical protein [Chitinophagaceae bacterium]